MDAALQERIRVLIVDDDPETHRLLEPVFDEGFTLSAAATLAEARAMLAEGYPDVAIIDAAIAEADSDGLDLLAELARESDATRCIVVSDNASRELTAAALNAGAAGYLSKPFNEEEVRQKVRDVVSKYRRTAEQRQRLRELDVVRAVGDAALTLDESSLVEGVVSAAVEGFRADGAALLLVTPSGSLRGAAQKGFSPQPIEEYVVERGQGVAGLAALTGQVQGVEDISAIEMALPEYITKSGLAAVLAAPLTSPVGVRGVLLVAWRRARAITLADRSLIEVIAQRAALGLDNARLYAGRVAERERDRFLAEAGQELASSMNEAELLDIIVRRAVPILGDGSSVMLVRHGQQMLDPTRFYHVVPEKQAAMQAALRVTPLRLGEGRGGEAALSHRATVFGPDILAQSVEQYPVLKDVGMRSAVIFPMEARGRLVGILGASISESDREYTDDDLRLGSQLAAWAALALDNAGLYRESSDRRSDLEYLFGLAQTVTQSMEVDTVLEELLGSTSNLLCAEAVAVVGLEGGHPRQRVDAWQGLSETVQSRLAHLAMECWPDEILHSEQPFFVGDVRILNHPLSQMAAELGLISLYTIPLGSRGEKAAVMMAWTSYPASYPPNTRQLTKTMGAFVGVALSNARSFQRELTIATTLQEILTRTPEHIPGLDFATAYHPALHGEASIGGDFYDIFPVGPDAYGLVIGDVSGKGLAAAAHWAMVKYALRAFALDSGTSPHIILSRVNEIVCTIEARGEVFITLFYAVLDLRQKMLRYASAGHDSPIVLRSEGDVEYLDSTGRALGLQEGAIYGENFVHLDPDDTLVLYTDGATDARRGSEFLELEGLTNLIVRHRRHRCREMVDAIFEDIVRFSSANLQDDVALVALRVSPHPPSA